MASNETHSSRHSGPAPAPKIQIGERSSVNGYEICELAREASLIMHNNIIIDGVLRDPAVKEYINRVSSGVTTTLTIARSARSAVAAALARSLTGPLVIITAHHETAQRFHEEVGALITDKPVLIMGSVETMPFERQAQNPEQTGRRLMALNALSTGEDCVVVCPVAATLQLLPSGRALPTEPLKIISDQEHGRDELIRSLSAFGYEREYLIERRGQFSIRGDIVDIFPGNTSYPVRIEFFGDTVESIREFNLTTQTSIASLREATVFAVAGAIYPNLSKKRIDDIKRDYPLLSEDIEMISEGQLFAGSESYWPLFSKPMTVFELIAPSTTILFDEPSMLELQADKFVHTWNEHLAYKQSRDNVPALKFLIGWEEIRPSWTGAQAEMTMAIATEKADKLNCEATSHEMLFGRIDKLTELISDIKTTGAKVVIAVETPGRSDRIKEILDNAGINPVFADKKSTRGDVVMARLPWTQGFWLENGNFALISENDIWRKAYRYRQDRQTISGVPIRTVVDMSVGDFVVHVNSGIGIFKGLETKTVMGVTREYMVIEYAEGDKLYVPLDQLDRVGRYVGFTEAPSITRLSGRDWQRLKSKAERSVKKLAFDLMDLYAGRLVAKKVPYGQDTVWQRELEESFPFNETPDQATAIFETKNDLQSTTPMDRLVCGDVGYGKTEVALRAAFKAVVEGHQVAVLVPTTILAAQHYQSFTARIAPFPVTIALLSRFVSKKDQDKIILDVASGKVDIIIGTHRLLQDDVSFKDLGLIVIDEEQRFGVGHKEKIKNLRRNIDVLALSATPIPRTLQMALSGVRDLSIINTPPDDRLSVSTHVGPYDEDLVVESIRRELAREGQIFYVHNRVATIDSAAARLSELVGQARIITAHGQMPEKVLERTMNLFLEKKADILMCTTIIESGIDIPNANTLIVEQAEKMGLAQLYQLRGRVGRAHQQAFAYFFIDEGRNMTDNAQKRLQTIGEFTQLGSGFKIAMQDLEIRGAGNLLGAEQSGNIIAVGFELYTQLLRDEVSSLQGHPVTALTEIRIDLPVDAYIPKNYIEEESRRVEAYQEIVAAKTVDEVKIIGERLKDRYGSLPVQVDALLGVAVLRIMARQAGVEQIALEGPRVRVRPVGLTKAERSEFEHKYQDSRLGFSSTTLFFDSTVTEPITLVKEVLGDIINKARKKQR